MKKSTSNTWYQVLCYAGFVAVIALLFLVVSLENISDGTKVGLFLLGLVCMGLVRVLLETIMGRRGAILFSEGNELTITSISERYVDGFVVPQGATASIELNADMLRFIRPGDVIRRTGNAIVKVARHQTVSTETPL